MNLNIRRAFSSSQYIVKLIAGKIISILPSRMCARLPKVSIVRTITLSDTKFRYFSNSNDSLWSHSVANFLFFEPRTLQKFIKELTQRERGLFLDIGAHGGLYGVIALTHGFRAVFFEANPALKRNIETNIFLNCSDSSMGEFFSNALGDSSREVQLFVGDKEHSAISSIIENKKDPRLDRYVTVIQLALDDLEFSPDIVKIDVEGYEENVLRGAIETIIRCKPIIFMEALTPEHLNKQMEILLPIGYDNPEVCGVHTHDSRNFVWRPRNVNAL